MLEVAIRSSRPDLDLAFAAPGGVTALFGPSGAGKTSILRAVAGLATPDAGRIHSDRPLFDSATGLNLPPHRRRIACVFQEPRLFPHLSVAANLRYGQRFAADRPSLPEARLIDILGIGPILRRRTATLSGGEAQRVALGRAILAAPRLLLLDEPMTALDAPRRAEIMTCLERLRDETGLPMLLVSHALDEVVRLATTLVMIEGGRLRAAGPVADLLADPALAETLGGREAGALLAGRVAGRDPDGLTRIDTAAGPLWLPQALVPGVAMRLRVRAADITLALTRPEGLSALNILPVTVTALVPDGQGPGVTVRLDCAGAPLLARITARSCAAMALRPGLPVWAVLKALSIAGAG